MIVRKATLKNVPVIVEMWKEFMKYHDSLIIKKNPKVKPYLVKKKDAAIRFKKFVQQNIRSKNAIVYIAVVGGGPVGYALCYIKDNIPVFKMKKIGYMSDLFVKDEFRKMKISSKLQKEVMSWFKKKGNKVHFNNGAQGK